MSTILHISTYFALGPFDSRRRYFRKVALPADKTINMVRGSTIAVNTFKSGVNTGLRWAWVCNSAQRSGGSTDPVLPSGFNTPIDGAI